LYEDNKLAKKPFICPLPHPAFKMNMRYRKALYFNRVLMALVKMDIIPEDMIAEYFLKYVDKGST
jgi:hypothetical protein